AAEVESVDVRRVTVAERTPEDELGTSRAQQIEVLAVVELEGGVVGDSDSEGADVTAPSDTSPRNDCAGQAGARKWRRQREESIEVDGPLDRRRETLSKRGREHALDRRDEAEVALGELERRIVREPTHELGPTRRAHGGPDQARMSLSAHAVGNDGGDPQVFIEALEAAHERRRAPRLGAR